MFSQSIAIPVVSIYDIMKMHHNSIFVDFLHTVMFTLYGNHFDSREEHLLLSVFEVCHNGRNACANVVGSYMQIRWALTSHAFVDVNFQNTKLCCVLNAFV